MAWQSRLSFAHCYGATQLIHSQVKAPLKVQRPFEGPGICHSVILHTAGVVGAIASLNFHLKPNATALVQQLLWFIAVIG